MHRLTNAVASVGRPLASKAIQRTFASSPVRSQKPVVRFYSTPATSVVAEPFLNGTSSTYVEEMYESWLENPSSVHKVVHICHFVFSLFSAHCCTPESHLGLRSTLDLAPKRLDSRLSHHLMTRLEVFVTKSATCTVTTNMV